MPFFFGGFLVLSLRIYFLAGCGDSTFAGGLGAVEELEGD
jgi:hypothetical protein